MKNKPRFMKVLAVMMLSLLFFQTKTIAQPCFSNFDYRVPIYLSNSLGSSGSNVEIELTINTLVPIAQNKMQSQGQDIRFLDRSGNTLDYWIDGATINNLNTKVWVKLQNLIGYSTDTIYLFYGNTSAVAKSDASTTFAVFDDFNGTSLGIKWTACGSGSTSVSGGNLTLTSTAANDIAITSTNATSGPILIEAKVVSQSGGQGVMGTINSLGKGYSIVHSSSGMKQNRMTSSASCFALTSYGASSTSGSVAGNWRFEWQTTGVQKSFWNGGSLSSTDATHTITGNVKAQFANKGGAGTFVIDYIRIRTFLSQIPTVSIAAEQTTKFTLTPTYSQPLCVGGDLSLGVDNIVGASYSWTGPNGFSSSLREPQITGVNATDAGRYDITVELPTSCASKSSSVNVNISTLAVGGSISGSQTVCAGSNTGQVSLNGQTGNVLRWEWAHNANGPWTIISNTSVNQAYTNLDTTTFYRVIVGNGGCSVDSSSLAVIIATPKSKGGVLAGLDTVCSGSNAGLLSVSGYVGNISKWQKSLNGNLWTDIVNPGTTHHYSNLNSTTLFRVEVQNGICHVDYSNRIEIAVDATSDGGSITGGGTACKGANNGSLKLVNYVGAILGWETSNTGAAPWTFINNTTNTISYSNLSNDTYYRAIVKNGKCGTALSAAATIVIIQSSSAGTIVGANTVCETGNSGTLNLTSYHGTIMKWQSSINQNTWTDIINSSASQNYSNLTDSTWYRTVVTNGSCPNDTSGSSLVAVNKSTKAGYVDGAGNVCTGTNSKTLKLKAYTGQIINWEESTNGLGPWTVIANTSDNLTRINKTSTSYYRINLKNGVCAEKTTASVSIIVDANSNAGSISADQNICELSNNGIVNTTGVTGTIAKWQTKTASNSVWQDVANTYSYQLYGNLTDTTYYRVIAVNQSCAADTSSVSSINVHSSTIGGVMNGGAEHCDVINTGTLQIQNFRGDVVHWEESIDAGATWMILAETNSTKAYNNIGQTTVYRSKIQSGVCPSAYTTSAIIKVTDESKAGTLISSSENICEGFNSGLIQLTGNTGNVQNWLKSEDSISWDPIVNMSNRELFYNLEKTTWYKAVVKNSVCNSDTASPIKINVSSASFGGTVSGTDHVCEGIAAGSIAINGVNGSIVAWEKSSDKNGPWAIFGDQNATQALGVLNSTQYVRVQVKNGVCPKSISEVYKITVDNESLKPLIKGPIEVCESVNKGTLLVSGFNGTIQGWEFKEDGAASWTGASSSLSEYAFSNLAKTTLFRVITKNGLCASSTSNTHTISTNAIPNVDFTSTNLCDGEVSTLTNTSTISNGSLTNYTWNVSNGASGKGLIYKIPFIQFGNYDVTLKVASDKGCQAEETKSLSIQQSPIANFEITNTKSGSYACFTETLKAQNKTMHNDISQVNWNWSFGDGYTSTMSDPTHKYLNDGSYSIKLHAVTRGGCADSIVKSFTVLPYNTPLIVSSNQVSKGRTFLLAAEGGSQHSWTPEQWLTSPKNAKTEGNISENTWFSVLAYDYNGCPGTDSIFMEVEVDYTVVPNNVITPEGNGENDVWVIANIFNYPDNTVQVFDRWGRQVFETEGYGNDWGATNEKGQLLSDGTYYYVISFDGSDKVLKGAITVINNK